MRTSNASSTAEWSLDAAAAAAASPPILATVSLRIQRGVLGPQQCVHGALKRLHPVQQRALQKSDQRKHVPVRLSL